jgi:hypothetical protein
MNPGRAHGLISPLEPREPGLGEADVDTDPAGDDVGPVGGSPIPPDVAVHDAARTAATASATAARDVWGVVRIMGGGSVAIGRDAGMSAAERRMPDARMTADPRKERP